MSDCDSEVPSKRKRYDSGRAEMENLSDEDVIQIDTGQAVNDERKEFFIGETDSRSDAEQIGNMDFDTAWTEIFPGDDLDHENSYDARVLKKPIDNPSCDQLIEVCPDDVKMERDDSTEQAGYEYIILSVDDAVETADQSG